MERIGKIYKLTCPENKSYIGQTICSVERRLYLHENQKNDSLIKDAIRRYGIENFKITILYDNVPRSKLNKLEKECIKSFKTFKEDHGYNQTLGGSGTKGHTVSEEARQKISDSLTGHKQSEETKRRKSESLKGKRKGCKFSDEHKLNLSKAHTGKTLSDETKKRMSESRKGRVSGMKGKKHTEESKRKTSESLTGKTHSDESKRKMSKAQTGRKHTEESKQKMSKSHTGKKLSEETKKRMSEAKKAYWAKKRKESQTNNLAE